MSTNSLTIKEERGVYVLRRGTRKLSTHGTHRDAHTELVRQARTLGWIGFHDDDEGWDVFGQAIEEMHE